MIAELAQIQLILWEDWDPIGVNGIAPNDEYNSYAFRIFVMLKEGAGEAEVGDYLRSAATKNMGLSDTGDCAMIARKIIRLQEGQR